MKRVWEEWLEGSERSLVRDERGRAIRLRRASRFSVEELWAALTTPARLAGWLGEGSGDFSPGGTVAWALRAGTVHTRILACEPRRRLAFTWEFGAPGRPAPDEVELRLEPAPQGAVLVLEHRSEMEGAWETAVGAGWELTWMLLEEAEARGEEASGLLSDRSLSKRLEGEWKRLAAPR